MTEKKIKYSDIISIPILDDLSFYYMNKIEKAPINPNNNIIQKKGNNNMDICKKHKIQYDKQVKKFYLIFGLLIYIIIFSIIFNF